MFGAIFNTVKTWGMTMFKSGQISPISLNDDDTIHMVSIPQTIIDHIFNIVNKTIRAGIPLLVLYMFYWFAHNIELAKSWIEIVAKIPNPMWDLIMVIAVSLGLSKIVRDVKNPPTGPQIVMKTTTNVGVIGDGAAKPPTDIPVDPTPVSTTAENPTLAAWKAEQAKKAK